MGLRREVCDVHHGHREEQSTNRAALSAAADEAPGTRQEQNTLMELALVL